MAAWLDDWTQISSTRLHDFNRLDDTAAREFLRGCLDVDRWIDTIVAGRPYASVDHLLDAARLAAKPFTDAEVERLCPHQPAEAAPSIPGVGTPSSGSLAMPRPLLWEARTHLVECLDAYEERFRRSFVIRRMGRSGPEIMAKLEARLVNDPETENRVVAAELRQIALLRLAERIRL